MRAAFRAKLTSDLIATVGGLRVLGKHPGKVESFYGDKQIHRPIRCEVLAVAAPANAGCQRFRYQLKTHRAAKTTTGSFSHVFVSPLRGLGLTGQRITGESVENAVLNRPSPVDPHGCAALRAVSAVDIICRLQPRHPLLHPLLPDVGINLRGGDALMAEPGLEVHPFHRHTARSNPPMCCRLVYHCVSAG